ncbi:MAG: undecaprenyldiphospho-muramoylpentapeptide beta-N-acetylglucosaminyltransferase [bacterium]|nr:undecaprenyldiphospho-muramoylpentapeptide beta-N-acetylglucosaminyltransferase [bacterium]
MKRILITGGGTGGHVYPGLAVAEALQRLAPEVEVRFAGTKRGLESVLVPRAGYRLHTLPASGLRGMGGRGRLLFLLNFVGGVLRSLLLLLSWRPDALLATGGFVGAPVAVAARMLGVPCALQEQNAVPGSANRLVARWARRVYLGFGEAARWFGKARVVETGNPVRAAFSAAAGADTTAAADPRRVLVFGGSRGARTLNRALEEAAAVWIHGDAPELRIQTGTTDRDRVAAAWSAADPARVRVDAYIEDMAAALAWADLVVCRAGAMTLAELQASGRPAVLVPFPHATDNHQLRNAEACAAAGAAVVLQDEDCQAGALTAMVSGLLADPDRLAAMGRAARGLARPAAAATIAADLLELGGHPAGTRAEGV